MLERLIAIQFSVKVIIVSALRMASIVSMGIIIICLMQLFLFPSCVDQNQLIWQSDLVLVSKK